jgi:hypothetical protein
MVAFYFWARPLVKAEDAKEQGAADCLAAPSLSG